MSRSQCIERLIGANHVPTQPASILVNTDFVGMKSITEMVTDVESLQVILEKENHTVIDVFRSRMIPGNSEFLSIRSECEDEPNYDRNAHECVTSREFLIPMEAINVEVSEIVSQIEGSEFIAFTDEGETLQASFWNGERAVYDLLLDKRFLTPKHLNYWQNAAPVRTLQPQIESV